MEPQQPSTQPQDPTPAPQPTPEMPPVPVTPPSEPIMPPVSPMSGPVVGSSMPQITPSKGGGGLLKNKNTLLAIAIGALLVLGGGAYAVYAYVTNTPEYLMNQATMQFWNVNQTAMAAKLKFATQGFGPSVTFSGDFALQVDPANHKNGEAVIGLGSSDSRVTATMGVFDEALYFKLGSLQNFGNLVKGFGGDAESIYGSPEFISALNRVNDKWFTISKDELKALAKESAGTDVSGSVSLADINQFFTIYNRHAFLRTNKTYADQAIDGVNSAHFSIKIDAAALKAFLTELKAANLKSFPVTDEDIKKTDTSLKDVDKLNIDVWIARDTKKFKQIQISANEQGAGVTYTITFETNLSNLAKLEKPTNTLPASKFIETLLGPDYAQMMGGSF